MLPCFSVRLQDNMLHGHFNTEPINPHGSVSILACQSLGHVALYPLPGLENDNMEGTKGDTGSKQNLSLLLDDMRKIIVRM